MGKSQPHADKHKLRRLNLDRQGLLKNAPFGLGKNATLKAIEQLGHVQIDTISVVARAHHHILHSRVPNYQPRHLDLLQQQGAIFEHWYHAAAYLPMRDYRFALPLMGKMQRREERWVRSHDDKLMREVLHYVAGEGPTRARDFETPSREGASGWWNWKPAKSALEQLFMQGDLMITGREGFQKIYDLRERVLPEGVDTRIPSDAEMAGYLIDNTLRSHGIASVACMTHGRIHATYRDAVKVSISEQLEDGQLQEVQHSGGKVMYSRPGLFEQRTPAAPARVKILSPFDNVVIQRPRGQTIFDFDYQIECYVPEAKRRFGYFCLPLLYKDNLIGRADCKAHRREGRFEVKSLHIENFNVPGGQDVSADRSADLAFAEALHAALKTFARFNGCEQLQFTRTQPGQWLRRLKQADKASG